MDRNGITREKILEDMDRIQKQHLQKGEFRRVDNFEIHTGRTRRPTVKYPAAI